MKIFITIKEKISLLGAIFQKVSSIQSKLNVLQEALGRVEARQLESLHKSKLQDNEFKVFSQWGEDGIIQYLLRNINIKRKIFVEFGVGNYTESNTRFLLINDNWSGLVMDGSLENINYIKQDPIYWQYNLKAVQAFIDKENINKLLKENGIQGEIGILSIDIDGNDYWIWQAIDSISPAIVVSEYNFRFGIDRSVTVPYDANFVRNQAHYSNIYFGASLKALCSLADRKGYAFVGCNSNGINAFFVRKDIKPDYIKSLSVAEGYVVGKFRELRNSKGQLTFLDLEEELQILKSLPLVEIN